MTTGAIRVHELNLNIGAVERETGLSKDVLRVWERRYGFPRPLRDDTGERQYTLADIAKLRAIKRLMDVGVRPGKVIALSVDEINALADARTPAHRGADAPALAREVIAILKAHDASALEQALGQWLMRHGLRAFALETLGPLNEAIGTAWLRGEIEVFEEHLYTERVQAALRAGIHAYPRQGGSPRVLLTTLPGEAHGLALLMVEALLACEGAQCISLGTQTPQEDVRRAALAHRVDIVALSFSGSFSQRQAADSLAALRGQLPQEVALWAGGEMTRRLRASVPGVVLLPDLAASVGELRSWRTRSATADPT
ncbi:MAG: MerR family transcriptional regulator [Candidatus Levyibacteriota bacterium]